jgi:hypothetical protein
MATLLSICQDAADLIGIPRPVGIMAGSDASARRLLAAATRTGNDMSRRWTWQALTCEHTFTSTATTVQASGLPTDWGNRILPDTFFNRTLKREVRGPLNSREWQVQQALTAAVLFDAYRIVGNELWLIPTPVAGSTYAYEYVTANWCESAAGTGQTGWVADTDVPRLDEEAMTTGVVWRFLQASGMEYAEAMQEHERRIMDLIAKDGSRRVVDMTGTAGLGASARYAAVPEGSWVI